MNKMQLFFHKRKLIKNFMREHGEHIPKYSPKGVKLEWNIFVYEDGEYDMMTGEFKGEHRVGISQKPPSISVIVGDNRVYQYDIETKSLSYKNGFVWG